MACFYIRAGRAEFSFFKCHKPVSAGVALHLGTADEAYAAGFTPAMLIEVKDKGIFADSKWLQTCAKVISMLERARSALGASMPSAGIGAWVVLTDLTNWRFLHVELGTWKGKPAIFLSKRVQFVCSLPLSVHEVVLSTAGTPAAAAAAATEPSTSAVQGAGPSSSPAPAPNDGTLQVGVCWSASCLLRVGYFILPAL